MNLTKEQVIEQLSKFTLFGEGKIMFKVIDYGENQFAPEKVAYRVHYTDYVGKRCKVTYYPNTVGFQWS